MLKQLRNQQRQQQYQAGSSASNPLDLYQMPDDGSEGMYSLSSGLTRRSTLNHELSYGNSNSSNMNSGNTVNHQSHYNDDGSIQRPLTKRKKTVSFQLPSK